MLSFLFCTDLYIFDYIIRKHFAPKFKIDKNDYDKSCSKKISDQEFVKKLACKQWNVQEIKEISKKYFNKSCSEKYCSSKSEKIKSLSSQKWIFLTLNLLFSGQILNVLVETIPKMYHTCQKYTFWLYLYFWKLCHYVCFFKLLQF